MRVERWRESGEIKIEILEILESLEELELLEGDERSSLLLEGCSGGDS